MITALCFPMLFLSITAINGFVRYNVCLYLVQFGQMDECLSVDANNLVHAWNNSGGEGGAGRAASVIFVKGGKAVAL